MYECKVGRCMVTVELNTPKICGNLNGYDIVVSEDDYVKKMVCKNLMKFSEEDARKCFWFENAVEFAKRYSVLADALDMANHNLMCYSTNLLMDTPKPEWANEWHREFDKVQILEQMIKELPHTVYMPPKAEEE